MSDTVRDRFTANLNQAKSAGSKRASSIQKILKEAALQTIAELKGGSSELSKTAKDTVTSTVSEWTNRQGLKSTDLEDSVGTSNVRPKADLSSLIEMIKSQASVEQLKEKINNLDAGLAARYGKHYEGISQKRREVLDWYIRTLSISETEGSNPVQDQQNFVEKKSGSAGASVAQKEQKIKQYFKTILRNAIPKS
jgi:hypothetical protein